MQKFAFVKQNNLRLLLLFKTCYKKPIIHIHHVSLILTLKFNLTFAACNTLLPNVEDIFTLRNYGKKSNCSISTLFPAAVRVLALDIGISSSHRRGFEVETGTLYKVLKCNYKLQYLLCSLF